MDQDPDRSTGIAEPEERGIAHGAETGARLQAEADGGRGRLAPQARRRAGRPRRIATAVLVVVTSLVVTVAVVGEWARRNALDTDRWVETVGPVIEDPAVQDALGSWMTTELMGVMDAEAFFEEALPQRGQVLAVPLTNALRGFVDDAVDAFLASDAVERLWVEVNRRAHERAVVVLEGDTVSGVEVEGDQVVLNLVPVLNEVLADIGEASPEILGRTVDLPTITVDDAPEEAVMKLENALGRDVPDDFGRFTVFEANRLTQVQDTVDLFNRFVVVTVVAAIALLVLTHALAPRRRRTLIQLMVGIALGVAVVRRLGLRLGDNVVDFAQPENRNAVKVVVDAFLSSLTDTTAWVLGAAALVATVAVLTGPLRLGQGAPTSNRVICPGVGYRRCRSRSQAGRSHSGLGGHAQAGAADRRDRRRHRRAARDRPVLARSSAAGAFRRWLRARRVADPAGRTHRCRAARGCSSDLTAVMTRVGGGGHTVGCHAGLTAWGLGAVSARVIPAWYDVTPEEIVLPLVGGSVDSPPQQPSSIPDLPDNVDQHDGHHLGDEYPPPQALRGGTRPPVRLEIEPW